MNGHESEESIQLQLVLDFESLATREFAELVLATNDLTMRASVAWLLENFSKTSEPYSTANPFYGPLDTLAKSYAACYSRCRTGREHIDERRGYSDVLHANCENVFEQYFDETVFASWLREDIPPSWHSVAQIREGNSVIVVVAFAAIALFTSVPPPNYSMIKDMALYMVRHIQQGVSISRPKGTLQHLPSVIDALRRNRNVKKFRLVIQDTTIDLTAEYHEKTR